MARKNQQESTALATLGEMGMGTVERPSDAIVVGPGGTGSRTLPKLVKLNEPGDYIDGLLVGKGAPIEVKQVNAETGVVSEVPVPTWVFQLRPDLEVKLMSNYQLDRELESAIGSRCRVILNGESDTRQGRRVKDFFVQVWDQDAEVVESSL